MGNKLFIGNINHSTSEASLEELFAGAGTVVSVKTITDRDSGRCKGFGFVEMGNSDEASKAISSFDGKDHEGRPLRVAEAKPMESRSSGGFSSGRSGGSSFQYGQRRLGSR